MARFLKPFEGPIFSVTRAMVGLLFMQHGLQKIFGALGGSRAEEPMMIAAGLIELIGGALVAVGLFTRWAAFLCSGLMASAYFMAHFPQAFFPIENRGELAVLYCFAFLFIAARGPGPLSVDAALGRDT